MGIEKTASNASKFSSRPNLNAADIRGKTALIYASAFGNKDIVEYLTQAHAKEIDVQMTDDTQKTALHHASKRARARRDSGYNDVQAEIVSLLLEAGAFMEARDHNGCTALMFAVANGDTSVVKRLLTNAANPNTRDFEGHTPLDYAKNFGHQIMGDLLKNAGAIDDDSDNEEPGLPSPTSATTMQTASASKSPEDGDGLLRQNTVEKEKKKKKEKTKVAATGEPVKDEVDANGEPIKKKKKKDKELTEKDKSKKKKTAGKKAMTSAMAEAVLDGGDHKALVMEEV